MPRAGPEDLVERFRWSETRPRLESLLRERAMVIDRRGRAFVAQDGAGVPAVVFEPPPLFPIAPGTESPEAWLAALPEGPGRYAVVLIQAGASALGLWEGDVMVRHRVIKKYVVRGTGRAQPLHLKTKGKSREGSRLRLRNAKAQLVETNEKLREWWKDPGPPRHVFISCPVRTWPELFVVDPPPPFPRDAPFIERVRCDVRIPSFDELHRIRARLARGRIIRRGPPSPAGDSGTAAS